MPPAPVTGDRHHKSVMRTPFSKILYRPQWNGGRGLQEVMKKNLIVEANFPISTP